MTNEAWSCTDPDERHKYPLSLNRYAEALTRIIESNDEINKHDEVLALNRVIKELREEGKIEVAKQLEIKRKERLE